MIPYLHLELFPEEYDFMMDEPVEARKRKCAINPMDQRYIDSINQRRYEMKVRVFMPTDLSPEHHKATLIDDRFISSYQYCERADYRNNLQPAIELFLCL